MNHNYHSTAVHYFSSPSVFADFLNVHLKQGEREFNSDHLHRKKTPIFCKSEAGRFFLHQNDLSMTYETDDSSRSCFTVDFYEQPEQQYAEKTIRTDFTEPLSYYAESTLINNRFDSKLPLERIAVAFYTGKNPWLLTESPDCSGEMIRHRTHSFSEITIVLPEEAEDQWFDCCKSSYRYVGQILKYRNDQEKANTLLQDFLQEQPEPEAIRFLQCVFADETGNDNSSGKDSFWVTESKNERKRKILS